MKIPSPEKTFEMLIRSIAFDPASAPLKVKKRILAQAWNAGSMRTLVHIFGPAGLNTKGENGFGFLVEALASASNNTPKNTPLGERFSRGFLYVLSTGDAGGGGTGFSSSNPDRMLIRIGKNEITIVGMVEVKSSANIVEQSADQLLKHEGSVSTLTASLIRTRAETYADWLEHKRVKVQTPLRKVLVVPHGQTGFSRKTFPLGWEIHELEFTYDELVFLARILWPEFRKDKIFGLNAFARYEKRFLLELIEYQTRFWKEIFRGNRLVPFKELTMFACALRKIPAHGGPISAVSAMCRKYDYLLHRYPTVKIGSQKLTAWEKAFLKKFLRLKETGEFAPYTHEAELQIQILIFLQNLRAFQRAVQKEIRQMPSDPKLKWIFEEYDLTKVLPIK